MFHPSPSAPAYRHAVAAWLREQFETSRATAGLNVRAMEGMRGFAVALVFLAHYCTLGQPWVAGVTGLERIAHVLHAIGNVGVDLFFVLSGYVIYKSLVVRPQPFIAFMARRVQRIYPAFLVVLSIYVVLSYVFPSETSMPRTGWGGYLVANLLLLPGLFPIKPLITVAWSLSYEMFFYLVVPLAVALFRRGGLGPARRLAALGLIAAALAYWTAGSEHRRMLMFFAGMMLHEAIASRQVRAPGTVAALAALAIALSGILLPNLGPVRVAVLFAGFLLLCLDCFLRPAALPARLFSWTPLRWLGNMSYSYYLLHGLCLKALFLVLGHIPAVGAHGAPAFVVLLLPAFALTLVPTAILFLLVERPYSLETGHARPATPHRVAVP